MKVPHDEAWYRREAEAIGHEDAAHARAKSNGHRRRAPKTAPSPAPTHAIAPATLTDVHQRFRQWLGPEYDLAAIDATLAAAAAEQLSGDPAWLLLISGPGNAKTETVQSLSAAGAILTSTIASEGALLSATPAREKAQQAHGGLLRRLGPRGLLVIKDMTSILSMHRDTRAGMLAALREVYDGYWERNVGTSGGLTLAWRGRLVIVGATTTAWDRAQDVIASMGDRFVLLRMNSAIGRDAARRQALKNTGLEATMRDELGAVVAGVLAGVNPQAALRLREDEMEAIGRAADVVTLCRTGVDYDYRGAVIDAHAPEMPTRFAKQLGQVMRGAVAVGMNRRQALRLALRCARDSMPPLRLAILEDVAAHPGSRTSDVRVRVAKPWHTVDRQLQALHMLGVLTCDELEISDEKSRWYYSVAASIDPTVIRTQNLSVHIDGETEEGEVSVTDKFCVPPPEGR